MAAGAVSLPVGAEIDARVTGASAQPIGFHPQGGYTTPVVAVCDGPRLQLFHIRLKNIGCMSLSGIFVTIEPQAAESAAEDRTKASKTSEPGVNLTDVAVNKVKDLRAAESKPDLRLRIVVQPGGCAGLSYQLFFDNTEIDGDTIFGFSTSNKSSNALSAGDDPEADHEKTSQQQPESAPGEHEVEVIIDCESLPYLSKATISYSDESNSQGFTIDNPNSTSACACGEAHH